MLPVTRKPHPKKTKLQKDDKYIKPTYDDDNKQEEAAENVNGNFFVAHFFFNGEHSQTFSFPQNKFVLFLLRNLPYTILKQPG